MSTALAVVEGGSRQLEALPDLVIVEAQVRKAVALGEKETLSDAAKRAEAQALYEKRNGYADREKHFARLRIMCEAGIALIACDETDGQKRPAVRADWLTYAAALDRDKLVEELERYKPHPRYGYVRFGDHLQRCGYTWVAGKKVGRADPLPWWRARLLVMETGGDPATLPVDKRIFWSITSRGNGAQAARRQKEREALAALGPDKQKLIAVEAKEFDADLASAYRSLRGALAGFESFHKTASPRSQQHSADVLYHLRAAEDGLAAMLGVGKVTR